jgi:GAF domain-containing protein
MPMAPVPMNEAQRLETLRLYRILDTEAEDSFDDIATVAAQVCRAPIALIGLVDKDRVWFKSRFGVKITEALRSVAFCAHTILEPGLFVVPDTTADARFADNPMVVRPPNVRFYAGAPLISREGHAIGTLCVLDGKPRTVDAAQERALRVLARAVMAQLELRRRVSESAAAAEERARLRERLCPECARKLT